MSEVIYQKPCAEFCEFPDVCKPRYCHHIGDALPFEVVAKMKQQAYQEQRAARNKVTGLDKLGGSVKSACNNTRLLP